MKVGSLVHLEWYLTPAGEDFLKVLQQPNTNNRRQLGFLERPNVPPNVEELSYKIFAYGKAGIGKTRTIARLAGSNTDDVYYETAGINVTTVYWPVKFVQTSKVVMFRLEFWEAGEMARKNFNHLALSCKEEMAATMFFFSFTDKKSFDAIPEQMRDIMKTNERPCPIIVGTRYDLHAATDVTTRDTKLFEEQWNIPIIKMKNIVSDKHKASQKAEFSDVGLSLNIICEQLWNHEQFYPH